MKKVLERGSIIKTRDSCQPELAIEPSASLTNSSGGSGKGSPSEKEELYVPLRKKPRKTDGKSSSDNVLDVLKTVVENDPGKSIWHLQEKKLNALADMN